MALVDSDAVWLLLTQLATETSPESAGRMHALPDGVPDGAFKPFRSLLPPRRNHGALAQREWNDGTAARARLLLTKLEAIQPPGW